MTKIKDLVTVLSDNALLFFPVDDERYELIAAIGTAVSWGSDIHEKLRSYEHGNWRVNLFLRSVDERIRVNASAYSTRQMFPNIVLRSLEKDRAERVNASLSRFFISGMGSIYGGHLNQKGYDFTCDFLWRAFYQRMVEQERNCRCYVLGQEGNP